MKSTKLLTFLMVAMMLMAACKGKVNHVQDVQTDSTSVIPEQYLMLEELSDTAIQHIRQSIASADTLIGMNPYREEGLDGPFNPTVYRLMERTMSKSFNYDGPYVYAHGWACQDTVARYFLDYLRNKDANVIVMDSLQFQRVINDIEPILEDYREGSQLDLNSASHIDMTMQTLKTIGTYKEMIALCAEKVLWKAYFMDYADWMDLFNGVILRQEDGYSMFPMLANGFGSDMMQLRYRLLQEEVALKQEGKECQWDVKAHPVDWSAENADLLKVWYDRRMRFADEISDKRFASVFKTMTEKTAYLFLNTVKFESMGEDPDEKD